MSEVNEKNLERAIPSAGYSITVKLKIVNKPGSFAKVLNSIASLSGSVSEVKLDYSDFNYNVREITINCKSEEHAQEVLKNFATIDTVELLEWQDDTFVAHEAGKLTVNPKMPLKNTDDLARAYTPGVARVCLAIKDDKKKALKYTVKKNLVAVITDGSAVLGLGNIGPEAAMPVMEGKAVLFKQFGGVDAIPICLNTQDTEEIIQTIKNISPSFGGINLEDISAPRCFEIENRLREELDIPVFHDDQHGTAVVVLAGLMNAAKLLGKKLENLKVVVNGFGAGGVACTKMIVAAGVSQIIPCDSAGIVYRGRTERMNSVKEAVIKYTNPDNIQGSVADALKGADVFLGVSQPGVITREMVQTMAKDPIIFALANPIPEILPSEISDIAGVIATGRSDYANQVNNVLCFPGIFRGALDCGATDITDAMKIAAARAIASAVSDQELHKDYIIPGVFSADIAKRVANEVMKAV
jgi:malate dehydrogenase (oxaloacetate-decarboxylating)